MFYCSTLLVSSLNFKSSFLVKRVFLLSNAAFQISFQGLISCVHLASFVIMLLKLDCMEINTCTTKSSYSQGNNCEALRLPKNIWTLRRSKPFSWRESKLLATLSCCLAPYLILCPALNFCTIIRFLEKL